MEAIAYKVTKDPARSQDYPDEPNETWSYYIRQDSMTPMEQEVARESNLRTRSGGYSLRREAVDAAKIDAEDIRRAAQARVFEV